MYSEDGDYHNEMNACVFIDWFENQLMPVVKEPSVIVLDNARYHNTRVEEIVTPTLNKTKHVLQDWLTKCRTSSVP